MKKDIEFHIGVRKCGKSEFVEKELEKSFQYNLYVGTLFPTEIFPEIIVPHQSRRNKSWILYETSGNIEKDFINLDNLLSTNKKIESCLIDGFSTWINLLARDVYTMEWLINVLVTNLIFLIKKHPICYRFIDVVPEVFEDKRSAQMCDTIRNYLEKEANNTSIDIKIIDWRYENIQNFMDRR